MELSASSSVVPKGVSARSSQGRFTAVVMAPTALARIIGSGNDFDRLPEPVEQGGHFVRGTSTGVIADAISGKCSSGCPIRQTSIQPATLRSGSPGI